MAEIAYICDIVGCDAETARRWLKVKNNDSAAVVNAWLDGTQLSDLEAANTWDDSAFTSVDREGNLDYNANLRPLGYSAAPTRGNSPVPSLKQPTSKAEEDADLERAFALSRGDDPYQGQETGTIGSNGQTLSSLRPASGGYYDPANWAMVPSSRSADTHQANEVIPDPDPEDRKYKVGNPRFLKPLASGMAVYLPGFLTIVRSIPLAREALLARGFTRPDYGFNDEWWKGHEIKMPKIVHIDESFTPAEPAVTEHEEVLAEMQRLMSFLDASHRAYGSADSLASTGTSPSTNTPASALDSVLAAWETAMEKIGGQPGLGKIFHSLVGTSDEAGCEPDMRCLPVATNVNESESLSLKVALDDLLWDTDWQDPSDTYMERCADILPIHFENTFPGAQKARLDVPMIIYADKYLRENVDVLRPVREEMIQAKKRIDTLDELEARLKTAKDPQGKPMNSMALLQYSIDHFSGANRERVKKEKDDRAIDVELKPPPDAEHHTAIAKKLEAVLQSIKIKLEQIETEKQEARETLSRLSADDKYEQLGHPPQHRYHLRGFSTKPNVTYVLLPRAETNTSITDEETPEGMQWWRIQYDYHNGDATFHVSEADQATVLQAPLDEEHSRVLLVYASDKALDYPQSAALSEPLQKFVESDNAAFATELANDSPHGITVERRVSIDSTANNYGDGEPPAYDFQPNNLT